MTFANYKFETFSPIYYFDPSLKLFLHLYSHSQTYSSLHSLKKNTLPGGDLVTTFSHSVSQSLPMWPSVTEWESENHISSYKDRTLKLGRSHFQVVDKLRSDWLVPCLSTNQWLTPIGWINKRESCHWLKILARKPFSLPLVNLSHVIWC